MTFQIIIDWFMAHHWAIVLGFVISCVILRAACIKGYDR